MNSLTYRLLIVFVVIAVLPLVLATGVFIHHTAESFDRFAHLLGREMDELNFVADSLEDAFRLRVETLKALGIGQHLMTRTRQEQSALLADVIRESPEFHLLAVLDESGRAAGTAGCRLEPFPLKEKYAPVLESGRSIRGAIYFGSEREPLLDVMVPIYREGAVAGVLLGRLSLKGLFLKFRKVLRAVSGSAYILGDDGKVLCLTAPTPGHLSPGDKVDLTSYRGMEFVERSGTRYLRAYVPLDEIGGQLLVERPFSHFNVVASRLYITTLLWVAFALLAAVLVGLWKVRKITVPLENLTEAAANIIQGKLDREVKRENSYEEINLLADSFERMRQNLGTTLQKNLHLIRITQEHLKERVGELKALHSVSEAFSTTTDLQQLFALIIEKAQSLFSASFCNLYLLEAQGLFALQISRGLRSEELLTLFAAPWSNDDPFLRSLVEEKRVQIHSSPAECEALARRLPVRELHTYITAPLVAGGRLMGFLELGIADAAAFTEEARELLATLGGEAAVAIANSKLYHQVVEEKLKSQTIIQSMSDGVFTLDADLRITSFNRAATAITGWSEEEVAGKFCFVIFQGRSSEGELVCRPETCNLARALAGGESSRSYELKVQAKDGSPKVLHFTHTIMKNHGRELQDTVVIVRDISKIRELEQLKSEFISSISHELRTPITSVKGCVATLLHPRATFDSETTKNFLKIISDEVERLNSLVQDLLEAARLESDRLILECESFCMEDVLERLLGTFRATGKHTFAVEPGTKTMAWGDPWQVEYVLKHLITNAVKYSPSGGTIEIILERKDDFVYVSVKDQGVGIPFDEKERIFEMFSRLHTGNTRWAYGTGMGLFLARKIIEAHGGKIYVESVIGKGSTFTFSLPSAKPAPGSTGDGADESA